MRHLFYGLFLVALALCSACATAASSPAPPPDAVKPAASVDAGHPAAAGHFETFSVPPAGASAEDVYRAARALMGHGRADRAAMLLKARVANPRSVRGVEAEENARLLALLGELAAAERPASDESFRRAETYLAWAIAADPCMGEYWHVFMRVRLSHTGYAGVLAEIQRHEPVRYRTVDIGFTPNSTIAMPWADQWLYLRGLLYAETDDFDRAEASLQEFKNRRNMCPVDQTLGELYEYAGRARDAVRYLKPSSEDTPGRRSALRQYVLGLALKSLGDFSASRQAFRDAELLDPTFEPTRSELLALDWQVHGDSATDSAAARELLSEHPADMALWITFWETRYRGEPVADADFQRFARAVASANPQLGAPAVAEAVSLLWDGDAAASAQVLARAAASGAGDANLWLASFLVAACRQDGGGAQQALDRLAHSDAEMRDALKDQGADALVPRLAPSDPGATETLTRLDEFLLGLGRRPRTGQLAGALGQACVHQTQKTPAGAQALKDSLFTDQILLGKKVAKLEQRAAATERQVALTGEQIRHLSAGAVRLLAQVTHLQEEQIRQRQRLDLEESQVQQLAAAQQALARDCEQKIRGAEAHLDEKLRRQEVRLTAALDDLAGELHKQGEQLEKQVQTAGATQDQLRELHTSIANLENWRKPSSTPKDTGMLSTALYKLSSVLSLGPSIGFASVNVIGLLAAVADLSGA